MMNLTAAYPATRIERDRFVLDRRPPHARHDPWRHQGVLIEDECAADGRIVRGATIFLTGRECPWRCVMCDLWRHTIPTDTPAGAIVRQLDEALAVIAIDARPPEQVKLYNAGSFFDPRAVPECDYPAITQRLSTIRHVVVESHPAFVSNRLARFLRARADAAPDGGAAALEVAIGLETSNPDALERLNKGFTLGQFAQAAERLHGLGVALRTFLLIGVPFIAPGQQQESIARSVAFAFDCGSSAVSLIPTRPGNGTLEALGFVPSTLADVEQAFDRALGVNRGRVFVDLWDLQRLATCDRCYDARRERLHRMNLDQRVAPSIVCHGCASTSEPTA